MQSTIPMDFKVYLIKNVPREKDKEPEVVEVRRFADSRPELVFSFVHLCQKIESLFRTLQGKTYSVFWKDNFGDFVSLSSDDEMAIAGREKVKIFYVIPGQSERPSNEPRGFFHLGITCDGCQVTPIVGHRFKCLNCFDYDLCSNCELRGIHEEHAMIRVNRPTSLMKNPQHLLKRRFNRLLDASYDLEGTNPCQSSFSDSDEAAECPFEKRRRHHKEKGDHHKHGKSHGHQRERGSRHEHGHDKRRHCQDVLRNVAGAASAVLTDSAGRPITTSIGQLLSYFVDPLGAPCQGREEQRSDATASARQAGHAPAAAGNSANGPAPSDTPMPDAVPTAAAPQPTTATSNQSSPGESLTNLIQTAMPNLAIAIQEITQSLAQQHVDPAVADWTVVNADGKEASPQPEASAVNSPQAPIQSQAGAASTRVYPDLTPPAAAAAAPNPRHPNASIQRGLETLQAMGYSNNSELLTHILELHNGDIHKALDVLQDYQK